MNAARENNSASRIGPPPIAETQRERVLRILREAGAAGVTNLELTFKHRISQSATRIHELRSDWRIDSIPTGDGNGSVCYILRGPAERPAGRTKQQTDFFEKRRYGLPLFDAATAR